MSTVYIYTSKCVVNTALSLNISTIFFNNSIKMILVFRDRVDVYIYNIWWKTETILVARYTNKYIILLSSSRAVTHFPRFEIAASPTHCCNYLKKSYQGFCGIERRKVTHDPVLSRIEGGKSKKKKKAMHRSVCSGIASSSVFFFVFAWAASLRT